MAISNADQKRLAGLARAANRRIERAPEGQRSAMAHYLRQYHTRQRADGTTVFSQSKAKSEAEFKARMRELENFMNAKTTTRKGWEAVKKSNVEKAGETLRRGGSNITDEELAVLLEEMDAGSSSAEFYKALANVEIAKGNADSISEDRIKEAMTARTSAQERTRALIEARAARER